MLTPEEFSQARHDFEVWATPGNPFHVSDELDLTTYQKMSCSVPMYTNETTRIAFAAWLASIIQYKKD